MGSKKVRQQKYYEVKYLLFSITLLVSRYYFPSPLSFAFLAGRTKQRGDGDDTLKEEGAAAVDVASVVPVNVPTMVASYVRFLISAFLPSTSHIPLPRLRQDEQHQDQV